MKDVSEGDIVVTAGEREYMNFLSSLVWADMEREIKEWSHVIISHLSTDESPTELYRMQGRKEACDEFLRLPYALLAVLRDKSQRTFREDDDEDILRIDREAE